MLRKFDQFLQKISLQDLTIFQDVVFKSFLDVMDG